MKYIISGTNRPQSRSLKLAQYIQKLYTQEVGEQVGIIDLAELPTADLRGEFYEKPPSELQKWVDRINHSTGLILVVPEYNGSMPGVLKYFIDFWSYPLSFEWRPVCFVGLGGMFGGLRPVEHLQQVFGYRNSFIYPERVFLTYVWKIMTESGEITDPVIQKLLISQVKGFHSYVKALDSAQLSSLTRKAH